MEAPERTFSDETQQSVLQEMYNREVRPMNTRRDKSILSEAVERTGLPMKYVWNWIGNYKKGPGRGNNKKINVDSLTEWTAFLRIKEKDPQDKSPVIGEFSSNKAKAYRKLKKTKEGRKIISDNLAQQKQIDTETLTSQQVRNRAHGMYDRIETEIGRLDKIGYKATAMIAQPEGPPAVLGPVAGVAYLRNRQDVVADYAAHMAGNKTQLDKRGALRTKVRALFKGLYVSLTGRTTCRYTAIINHTIPIKVRGMPTGVPFDEIKNYSVDEMEAILKEQKNISFQLTQDEAADVNDGSERPRGKKRKASQQKSAPQSKKRKVSSRPKDRNMSKEQRVEENPSDVLQDFETMVSDTQGLHHELASVSTTSNITSHSSTSVSHPGNHVMTSQLLTAIPPPPVLAMTSQSQPVPLLSIPATSYQPLTTIASPDMPVTSYQTLTNLSAPDMPVTSYQTLTNLSAPDMPVTSYQTLTNLSAPDMPVTSYQTLTNLSAPDMPITSYQTLTNLSAPDMPVTSYQTLTNLSAPDTPATSYQTLTNLSAPDTPATSYKTLTTVSSPDMPATTYQSLTTVSPLDLSTTPFQPLTTILHAEMPPMTNQLPTSLQPSHRSTMTDKGAMSTSTSMAPSMLGSCVSPISNNLRSESSAVIGNSPIPPSHVMEPSVAKSLCGTHQAKAIRRALKLHDRIEQMFLGDTLWYKGTVDKIKGTLYTVKYDGYRRKESFRAKELDHYIGQGTFRLI